MRFLYKRPRIEDMNDELITVMEVMVSDLFIYLDLFVFSLIFTLMLSHVIGSLALSILFFFSCYALFSCVYYFVFKKKG